MRDQQIIAILHSVQKMGPLASHFESENVVVDLSSLKNSLNNLARIPGLNLLVQQFINSTIYGFAADKVTLLGAEYRILAKLARDLDLGVATTLLVLTAKGVRETPEEILVKLPPIEHLADIAEFCHHLDRVITQSLGTLNEPPIADLKGWENGSLWLEISVGSVSAVVVIGGVAWAAAVAYKKLQEGRLLEKQVEALGIKNELLAHLRDKTNEAVGAIIDVEAKRLYRAYRKDVADDPESVERLKYCIKEMSSMIEKGTEVHPAFNAPEDVKNLFPNLADILALPEIVPLLTNQRGTDASGDSTPPP